jgi:hypothetical protein
MPSKPMFSPDQDMSDVTPQNVADAKRRAKETEAFNKLLQSAPLPTKGAAGVTGGTTSTPKPPFISPTSKPMMNMAKGGAYTDKGGKINLGSGRISTHTPSKSNPSW